MTLKVQTVATSNADDASFLALADIAAITGELDDVRIVGGHMATLLVTAFPSPGTIVRRTADADAATTTTTVASSGVLHDALTASGYVATSGNRYTKGDLTIDLLVPSPDATFRTTIHGDRAFDAGPGLALALAARPLELLVGVLLTTGERVEIAVRVPPVEIAVILKAYAITTRNASKDYTDLFNLLTVARHHDAVSIGGWRLAEPSLRGSRADGARLLEELASQARRNPLMREAGVRADEFAALIRELLHPA